MIPHDLCFTHSSVQANKYVAAQMEIIVPEIVRSIPGLRSIILMGGYGRGEGAVGIDSNGFRLINDFDFYVICDKYVDDEYLEGVAQHCSKMIGKGGIAHPEGFLKRYDFETFFHIDIRCLVTNKLHRLPPAIRYYEMKHASTVLYGDDLRYLFPGLKAGEIPKPEGIRLLMNRMLLLIMAMREGFLNGKESMKADERGIMAYYIGKGYLSCAEAILLFHGKYLPTYCGRAEYFAKHFPELTPDLAASLPHLPEKVRFFTEYKSNPDPGGMDIISMWFQCRQDIIAIYKYCLERLMGRRLPDSPLLQASILKKSLASVYFAPYADYYADRLGLSKRLASPIINIAGRYFLTYKYCHALKKEIGRLWWRPLFGLEPGIVILYLAPLVLQGINENGTGNPELFPWIWQELSSVFPLPAQNNRALSWTRVKTAWLKAYRTYYLQRFV